MMKDWQYYISLVMGAACLILAIFVVRIGKTTQQLQMQLQQQQNEINSGLLNQNNLQLANNILTDMAKVALSNARMSKVLADNGYTINTNQAQTGAVSSVLSTNARKTP
jgi:hypothetical protein